VALGAPTNVTLTPPGTARLLVGQRVDLRVEGKGTGPFSATLKIDGVDVPFTSGLLNSTATDGITSAGWGGFNVRGFEFTTAGNHTLSGSFTDSTGTVDIPSRTIRVYDVSGNNKKTKNVIIFLGDGMGAAHRTAGRLVRYGATEGEPNGYLTMEQFPGTGLVATHSLNSVITDSAPGMAGYVSGQHVKNGQEGVYPANVTNPFFAPRVEYLAEYLHRTQGTSLGIVSTADLEDATPAAMAVHTANRGNGTGIVDQYLDESDFAGSGHFGTGLSVLLGGGRRWFLPAGQPFSSRGSSTDYPRLPDDLGISWGLPAIGASRGASDSSRDLIGAFRTAGFTYVETATDLKAPATASATKLLGLFAYGNMNVALDKVAKRRNQPLAGSSTFVVDDYHAPDQPMLPEMTQAALEVLKKNTNGFVLLVEGAHIDKQSHLMDADRAVGEVLELDDAIKVARDFADTAGDTVIIVTADHECSGFSIIGGLSGGIAALQGLASDRGVPELDPASSLAQQGTAQPKRQGVVGTYDTAGFPTYRLDGGYPETFDVDGKLLFGFGANGDRYEGWLTKPLPVIDSLLPNDLKNSTDGGVGLVQAGYAAFPYARAESATGFFIRGQVPGDQAVHTASDIPVAAYSSGTDTWRQFVGVQQNTEIFFKLSRAVLGGYQSPTVASGAGGGTQCGAGGGSQAGAGGGAQAGSGGGSTAQCGGGSGTTPGSSCSAAGGAPILMGALGLLALLRARRRRS
jgi:alkaline phosphatase